MSQKDSKKKSIALHTPKYPLFSPKLAKLSSDIIIMIFKTLKRKKQGNCKVLNLQLLSVPRGLSNRKHHSNPDYHSTYGMWHYKLFWEVWGRQSSEWQPQQLRLKNFNSGFLIPLLAERETQKAALAIIRLIISGQTGLLISQGGGGQEVFISVCRTAVRLDEMSREFTKQLACCAFKPLWLFYHWPENNEDIYICFNLSSTRITI